jgi:hypothetical protein
MKKLLAVLVLALFGYEAWTLSNAAPGDTISEVVWTLADAWQIVPFLFGLVGGHFFWPRKR